MKDSCCWLKPWAVVITLLLLAVVGNAFLNPHQTDVIVIKNFELNENNNKYIVDGEVLLWSCLTSDGREARVRLITVFVANPYPAQRMACTAFVKEKRWWLV